MAHSFAATVSTAIVTPVRPVIIPSTVSLLGLGLISLHRPPDPHVNVGALSLRGNLLPVPFAAHLVRRPLALVSDPRQRHSLGIVLNLELIGDASKSAKVFAEVGHRGDEVAVKRAHDHFGIVVVELRHLELFPVVVAVLLPVAMRAAVMSIVLRPGVLPAALRALVILHIARIVILRIGVPARSAVAAVLAVAEVLALLSLLMMLVLVLMRMLMRRDRVSVARGIALFPRAPPLRLLLVGARRLRLSPALPALVLLTRTLGVFPLFAEIRNGDIALVVIFLSSAIGPPVERRVHIQHNQLLVFPHRHFRRFLRVEIVQSGHLVVG